MLRTTAFEAEASPRTEEECVCFEDNFRICNSLKRFQLKFMIIREKFAATPDRIFNEMNHNFLLKF